jgi:hypothetical protein
VRKDYALFTEAEAAPLHVQAASLSPPSQPVFRWLDEKTRTVSAPQ